MTDPIADMLTRIRNAITARKAKVAMPSSKIKREIARVLVEEGFVNTQRFEEDDKQGVLTIELRYDNDNRNAIQGIRRKSRPGQREYVRSEKMPRVRSGLGIAILTTSKGIMTERAARKQQVGGELLCEVW
jgi:small subunit ribosomal protein S8